MFRRNEGEASGIHQASVIDTKTSPRGVTAATIFHDEDIHAVADAIEVSVSHAVSMKNNTQTRSLQDNFFDLPADLSFNLLK